MTRGWSPVVSRARGIATVARKNALRRRRIASVARSAARRGRLCAGPAAPRPATRRARGPAGPGARRAGSRARRRPLAGAEDLGVAVRVQALERVGGDASLLGDGQQAVARLDDVPAAGG